MMKICTVHKFMLTTRRCTLLLLPALLSMPFVARAADDERQLPVHLRADRIDADQKKGTSLYRGNVVFTQGTLRITAARAEVQNRASVVETITAGGKPVTFRHRPEGQEEFIEGEANRVVYHALTQHADLFGAVQVKRGRDLFRSAALHYDVENQSLIGESTSERRVYVALVPHAAKPTTAGDRP